MKIKNTIVINSFLMALFIMQYTYMLPLMNFISPSICIAISGMVIMAAIIINNRKVLFNKLVLLITVIIAYVLAMKVCFDNSDAGILIVYSYTTIPAALMVSYSIDWTLLLEYLYKISVLSFFLVFWNPLLGTYSYMRFGYAVLPILIFIIIHLFYNKANKTIPGIVNLYDYIICGFLGIELLIFGARGAMLSLILFFIIEEMLINRSHLSRKVALFIAALLAYFNLAVIINAFFSISRAYGIRSYALSKINMHINRGLEASSSGRVELYGETFEKIMQHPFFGNAISLTQEDGLGVSYSHNLFLQVWMDLGIGGLIAVVIIIILAFLFIMSRRNEIKARILIASLLSISIGRLLVSSVLWRRPEFWIFVFCTIVVSKSVRKKNIKRVGEKLC